MSFFSPTISVTPTAPGWYQIDPRRTEIRFTARNNYGLSSVGGTLVLADGELHIASPTSESTVSAVIDATSFDTRSAKRDAGVCSARYLDVTSYPRIVFTCSLVEQRKADWVAVGVVEVHGVLAPLDLIVHQFTRTMTGELAIHATARIDRHAHGVTTSPRRVGRWLEVEVTALASPKAGRHSI